MSYFDTLEVMKVIKEKFNNVDVNIDICTASKRRQIALYNEARKCDIVLIIGDKSSNNTAKLKEISESFGIKSYLIENIEDLKNIEITNNIKKQIKNIKIVNKDTYDLIKNTNEFKSMPVYPEPGL